MQRLDLGVNMLRGNLNFIQNMPFLTELRLDTNQFTGTLPNVFQGPWQVRVCKPISDSHLCLLTA